jgi:hypothetical protein
MKKYFLAIFIMAFLSQVDAQNNRQNTYNNIGWFGYFGTFKLDKKWSLHGEYQLRRNDWISEWQQGLFRVGVNYQYNPRVLFRTGYAHAETYPYGEIPLNGFGKQFTEHRTYQMVQLTQKEGILDISHRFMLEQRWVGKYSNANLEKEDQFPLWHRMRYMTRLQMPLNRKEMADKTLYAALYDEVLIGFGKNVNANIFDQNRIGALLGYRINKNIRIEAGYINQTVQYGRQINGKNIFQRNNGIFINAFTTLDFSKK